MICGLICFLFIKKKRGETKLWKVSKNCVTNRNEASDNAAFNISSTDNKSYGVLKATDNVTRNDPEVGVAVTENESYGVCKTINNSSSDPEVGIINACYEGLSFETTENLEDYIYMNTT